MREDDMILRIQHFNKLNLTPALPLALLGWSELVERGYCRNVVLVFWDNNAIVAFDGDRPIGVITYSNTEWLQQISIMIGYVIPDYRGHGVYRKLWSALVAKAQELGVTLIEGNTHLSNETMRIVAEKLGRIEDGVILRFDVKPKE